jgi:hypothetical protein
LEALPLIGPIVRAACISIPVLGRVLRRVSRHHGPLYRNMMAYLLTTVFLPDEAYWFDH